MANSSIIGTVSPVVVLRKQVHNEPKVLTVCPVAHMPSNFDFEGPLPSSNFDCVIERDNKKIKIGSEILIYVEKYSMYGHVVKYWTLDDIPHLNDSEKAPNAVQLVDKREDFTDLEGKFMESEIISVDENQLRLYVVTTPDYESKVEQQVTFWCDQIQENACKVAESQVRYVYYCFYDSTNTNRWTRGLVERIEYLPKTVIVRCVDYGHATRIRIDELRELPPQITLELLPPATIAVQARNLAVNTSIPRSNDNIKKTFMNFRNKKCWLFFCKKPPEDRIWPVEILGDVLHDSSGRYTQVNVGFYLLQKTWAVQRQIEQSESNRPPSLFPQVPDNRGKFGFLPTPPLPTNCDVFVPVKVIRLELPDKVWIVYGEKKNELFDFIDNIYSSPSAKVYDKLPQSEIYHGRICMAKVEIRPGTMKWARCRIVEVKEVERSSRTTVEAVDYGLVQEVSPKDIATLVDSKILIDTPPVAYCCRLGFEIESQYDRALLEAEALNDKNAIFGQFVDDFDGDDRLSIEWIYPIELFTNQSIPQPIFPQSSYTPSYQFLKVLPSGDFGENEIPYYSAFMVDSSKIDIDEFYVNLVIQSASFSALNTHLITNVDFNDKNDLQIGELVVVSTNDQNRTKRRARLIHINERENKAGVVLLDFGDEIYDCALNELYRLPTKYWPTPARSIKCQLIETTHTEIAQKCFAQLKGKLDNQKFVILPETFDQETKKYGVSLYFLSNSNPSKGYKMNDLLTSWFDHDFFPQLEAKNADFKARTLSIDQRYFDDVSELNKVTVEQYIMTWVKSPYLFYLLPEKWLPVERSIFRRINLAWQRWEVERLEKYTIGAGCIASYESLFYRGQIVRVFNEDKKVVSCDVLFVDYGNIVNVEIEHIYRCPSELFKIPKLAIPCAMHDLAPINPSRTEGDPIWDPQLCDLYRKAKNETVNATISTAPFLGCFQATIFDKFGQDEFFVKQTRATKIAVDNSVHYMATDPQQVLTPFAGAVHWVTNPYEMWIATLKEYDSYFQLIYPHTNEQFAAVRMEESNIVPGRPCVVPYSIDITQCADYCRATIVEPRLTVFPDERECNIFFVDYGNSIIVKYYDIFETNRQLLTIPGPLVKRARLHGLAPNDDYIWNEKVTDWFWNTLLNENLQVVINSFEPIEQNGDSENLVMVVTLFKSKRNVLQRCMELFGKKSPTAVTNGV